MKTVTTTLFDLIANYEQYLMKGENGLASHFTIGKGKRAFWYIEPNGYCYVLFAQDNETQKLLYKRYIYADCAVTIHYPISNNPK